jgi:hypothetical protein
MRLFAAGAISLLAATYPTQAQEILYGGAGVSSTDNVGVLMTINQSNGSGTIVGTPGEFGLSGISFNSLDQLYATSVGGTGTSSSLLLLDPNNGSVILNIGVVMAGSQALKIGDLAFQPGTGTLYGVTANNGPTGSPAAGTLYTINLSTGAATLVGNTGSGVAGAIGFAPNGTLYYITNGSLRTLNPANGMTTSSIAVPGAYDALGVRSDGVLFASPGNSGDTYIINPMTGAATNLGNSGLDNGVSDLAFRVVPEPSTCALVIIGVSAIAWVKRVRRSKTIFADRAIRFF